MQLIRSTQLKPRVVRAAILTLVQHNLLLHDRVEGEGEVLEMNIGECLARLRYGRYVWQAEQLFGNAVCLEDIYFIHPNYDSTGERDSAVGPGPWKAGFLHDSIAIFC